MPYAYAYAGFSFRHVTRYHFEPVLHSQKKILRGYCEIVLCANAPKLYKQLEYIFQKFLYFFFICFLGCPPSRVLAGAKSIREVI